MAPILHLAGHGHEWGRNTGGMSRSYILIADDDPTIRALLTELLEDEGYTVQACCDGFDALCAARCAVPALLILDVAMPMMSGDEVMRRLRDDGFEGPIIIASAATDLGRFLRQGATRVLPKPFELHTLLHLVAELVAAQSPLRALALGEQPPRKQSTGRQAR